MPAQPTNPPRKRALWLGLLGLFSLLCFLLATLPARTALGYLAGDVPGLHIGSARGTVWNARLGDVRYRQFQIPAMKVELAFWPLITGTVSARVEAELPDGFLRFSLQAGTGGTLEIRDLQAALPLARIAPLLPGLPAGVAQGELTLKLDRARFENRQPVAATGRAALVNLTSTWTGERPLGDYAAEISTPEAGRILADITDLEGPVRLDAEATLTPDGNWQTEGSIAARDSSDEMLDQALRYLGPADATGAHSFRFSGRLR